MKYRLVMSQLGLLLAVLSGVMLLIAAWAVIDWQLGHGTFYGSEALLLSAGLGLLVGGAMWWAGRSLSPLSINRREALLLVGLSWLVGAAVCALPYLLWAHLALGADEPHPFHNFVDCYFESMSGLTTTGASVLSDIEALPRSLLLWRAFTHWIGGVGIVVLFVAVLPGLGVGGKKVYQMEAPGPTKSGVRPRIAETARVLWLTYLVLTGAEIVALWGLGMTVFDAICHTFATVATGGFANYNASIGRYNSPAIHAVITLFMVLAAVNFGVYYRLIRGGARNVWRDAELRWFLTMLAVGGAVVVGSIYASAEPIVLTTGETVESDLANSVQHGLFTTASIHTTTGFATADFNVWPFLATAALVGMMFIGGCAGSTAGGIKVIRVYLAAKILLTEIERVFHPYHVKPVRVGDAAVDPELRLSVLSYCVGIALLFVVGSIAIMLFEQGAADYTTAATASIASLFSIGPGLGKVGAVFNYGWMTDASKILCSLLMVLGRLEVFAIVVLFMPSFWRER